MSHIPTLVGINWTKSSYSSSSGGTCIEFSSSLAPTGIIPVRDSKVPHGPALAVTTGAWRSFLGAVQLGELAG
ncbi:DUF397 domain-containing protein [Streptomyces avicenniae]|uniref:DUF397 domain-containing protein n=1 Tax=Streptomyces avicenniae TaxID=500153 RepID=UPI000DA5F000|nr:DUF397 domain-containing protein [Streptomyces avicenniae]